MANQLDTISSSTVGQMFPSGPTSSGYTLRALSKRGLKGGGGRPRQLPYGVVGAAGRGGSNLLQSGSERNRRLEKLREVVSLMDSKVVQKKPKRRGKEVGREFDEEDETIPRKRPQPYRPPPVSQTLPNVSSKRLMEKLSPRDSVVKREEVEMKKEKQGKISHPSGKTLVRMDTTIMAARWKIRARGKRKRGRKPRRRMAGFIQTEADLEEEDEDGDFIQKTFGKLRTAVKLVIYLLRLSKTYIVTENDARMIQLFNEIDAAETGEKYKIKGEELFDPVMFRANKQQRVGAITRKILGKDPSKRTDKEIYHVHVELQQLKSITKYPLEMQRELIRNAWYEDYPSGRIILRYGRRPQAFYVIIGGSAVILEGDPDKKGRGASGISKGDVFGDEAIINSAKHNYTVISKDKIQLLCLSKEDYIRIFMAGGFSNVKSYENSFIQSISIFKGWPVHLLKDNINNCKFNYFIGGTVIEEDSQKSKWIYIVKSGSCAVMKKVKVTRSKKEIKKISRVKKVLESKRRKHVSDHETLISQKLKQLDDNTTQESKKRWKSSYFGPSRYIKLPLRDNPFTEEGEELTMIDEEREGKPKPGDDQESPVQPMDVSGEETANITENNETGSGTYAPSLTQFSSLTKGPYMKPRPLAAETAKFQNQFLSGQNGSNKDGQSGLKVPTTSTVEGETSVNDEEEKNEEEDDGSEKMETDYDDEQTMESIMMKKPTEETKLVLIDTIVKGAVFGVLDIAFGPQPSLTLVSNGAECVMISKKLYIKHMTEGNMKTINDEMRPYANEETLQRDLSEKLTWGDHKSSTLSDTAIKFKKYRKMVGDPRLPRAGLLPKL